MVDVGAGAPVVLIPGIQGRWEWMRPSVDALARENRVIACSLPGEPGAGTAFDGRGTFDQFVRHLDDLLDARGVDAAILCGVSFGGLIALRYAAQRADRVRGLVLVSTPGPGWKLNPYQARYARWPTISSPVFALGAVRRGWREMRALYPAIGPRLGATGRTAWRVLAAPAVPRRMAQRARVAERENFEVDCRSVSVPTLIITGERTLDQVVPCEETLKYADLIPGATCQLLERTGHLGTVLAPERFAQIVSRFSRGL